MGSIDFPTQLSKQTERKSLDSIKSFPFFWKGIKTASFHVCDYSSLPAAILNLSLFPFCHRTQSYKHFIRYSVFPCNVLFRVLIAYYISASFKCDIKWLFYYNLCIYSIAAS